MHVPYGRSFYRCTWTNKNGIPSIGFVLLVNIYCWVKVCRTCMLGADWNKLIARAQLAMVVIITRYRMDDFCSNNGPFCPVYWNYLFCFGLEYIKCIFVNADKNTAKWLFYNANMIFLFAYDGYTHFWYICTSHFKFTLPLNNNFHSIVGGIVIISQIL